MPAFWKVSTVLLSFLSLLKCDIIDPNGYILYCPCMGRFGNQADHFLGSLAFAHGLNRTLVLPHWVEYRLGEARSIQVPFDSYFSEKALLKFHKVMTMNKFMSDIARKIWTEDKRISFCYVARGTNASMTCNAKEGNPFGPFWDTFGIDFVESEFYAPLHYDVNRGAMSQQWNMKYPPSKWPVLAFTGAPASFPVQDENRKLHKYLQWNTAMETKAKQFIKSTFKQGGFIGIHLRNGADWVRACQHVSQSPALFAGPQCVGYRNEHGPVTHDMCLPTKHQIIKQLKRLLKSMKDVKYIFVASDSNHMIADLREALKRQSITIHRLSVSDPHLDLAILGLSNHFVGNCVSSYSAFAKRERDVRGLPSSFWAFPSIKSSSSSHDEL